MTMQYRAILPKRDPAPKVNIQRALTELRHFGVDARNFLKTYPPVPPDSSYRRTGDLSRGWGSGGGARMVGGDLKIILTNSVEYMVWVQGRRRGSGPRQRALFARYGWGSISDVNTKIWPRYRNRIEKSLGLGRVRITRSS